MCAGFFVSTVAILLDIIGGGLELWAYPVRVIPIIACFIPWDISALPVVTMLFLQLLPKINPFIKGAVYAFSGAFICEPLAIKFGFASEPHWRKIYSFPIIFGIYLLSHVIAKRKTYEAIYKTDG